MQQRRAGKQAVSTHQLSEEPALPTASQRRQATAASVRVSPRAPSLLPKRPGAAASLSSTAAAPDRLRARACGGLHGTEPSRRARLGEAGAALRHCGCCYSSLSGCSRGLALTRAVRAAGRERVALHDTACMVMASVGPGPGAVRSKGRQGTRGGPGRALSGARLRG